MVNKTTFILAILILTSIMFSLASAYDTPFTIKTGSNYNITIRTLNIEGDTVESFYATSNNFGTATLSVSTTLSTFAVYLLVQNPEEGKIVSYGKYENLSAGEEITIDAVTGKIVPKEEPVVEPEPVQEAVENTTEVETPAEEPAVTEDDSKIGGMAVSGNSLKTSLKNIFNKTGFYIFGLIIAIGAVAFFVFTRLEHKSIKPNELAKYAKPLPKKTEEDLGEDSEREEEKLTDAENKLKEALEEVNKLKAKRKEISEAEKAYKEAKEKLDSLKNEQD
ncbi:hypothetical protein COV15_02245 [Candidatus Woesearchaeota archaeon CG10_big_fil_rev_8_21_14_0_10_34_12]|nr:MAG: hypothetical protein COV15_02245 [Candidatus Woesearchaeota archaeon CG10_big_fil_rev_8_21_14_0_10_34_12]